MPHQPRQPLSLPTIDRLGPLAQGCPDLPQRLVVWGVDPGPRGGAWVRIAIEPDGSATAYEWCEWWTAGDTMHAVAVIKGEHAELEAPPEVMHDKLVVQTADSMTAHTAGAERPYISGRRQSLVDTIESAGAWRVAAAQVCSHQHLHRPMPQEWRAYLGVLRGGPRGREIDRRVREVTMASLGRPMPLAYGTADEPTLTRRGRAVRHLWDAIGVAWYAAACTVAQYVAGSEGG